jgi:hypothetical protein
VGERQGEVKSIDRAINGCVGEAEDWHRGNESGKNNYVLYE